MLNLKSLEYRRVEFDLIFMYKIIHGYVDINFSDVFSVCHSGYNLHRYSFTINSFAPAIDDLVLSVFSSIFFPPKLQNQFAKDGFVTLFLIQFSKDYA